MGKRMWTGAFALTMLSAMLVALPAAPAAAATSVLANWQMNEGSNASQMTDSSGNGIHGDIGSAVVTGATYGGATAYRWTNTQPNQPPAKPERLLQVDDDRLNPGTGDYAIEMRFRTTRSFGNMIQKGQSNNPGGYFKWQIPNGRITCLFRGYSPNGTRQQKAVSSGSTPLNDGDWHTVRCERTGNQLVMTVDGRVTGRGNGPTGSISNDVPMTIGGKLNCNQQQITCDYFVGDIDYVIIESEDGGGDPPPPPPPPPPGGTIFADDFSNGLSDWTTVTRVTAAGSNGNPGANAQVDVSNQSAFAYKRFDSAYTTVCVSVDINQTQLDNNVLIRLKTATSGAIARVVLDGQGRLRVRSDVSGVRSGALGQLGSGWHNLELCGSIAGTSTWDLYRDGVKILDSWTANSGTTGVGRVYIGDTSAKTWEARFDNVVVDQSPG